MNYKLLKIWSFLTFTAVVIAIVIRSIWQIVNIPTSGTMLIFIPLIVALLGANALFAYLLSRPAQLRSRWFAIGSTVIIAAGFLAGVTHFVRFIISPQAAPLLSKIIGALVVSSSSSAGFILIYIIWSLRKKRRNG